MESEELAVDEQNGFLKFDKRILIISVMKKFTFILLATFVVAVLTVFFLKISVKKEWKATVIIIRHSKNLSSSSDMPYLYQQFDMNTVVEAIATRENLKAVIDSLKMELNYKQLFSHISIKKGNKANIIHLSATHLDRNSATDIANALASIFIQNYVKILNSSTQQIYSYYEEQRISYLDELKVIQQQLAEFRQEYGIVSPESEATIKYEQLNEMELNLLETQMNINALETKLADIVKRLANLPDQIPISYTVTSTKEGKLREMKDELTILSQKYTDENPKIIKLRDEIAQMEQEIATSDKDDLLPDIVSYGEGTLRENLVIKQNEYDNELKSSRELISEYEEKIANLKLQLQSLSSLDNEYYKIKRKEDLIKDLLKTIEGRIVEANISIGSNVSDFEILQYAVPPDAPVGTSRKIVFIAIVFLSFLTMTVYAVFKELLSKTVKSNFDFEQVLELPLMSELPDRETVAENIFYNQMQICLAKLNDFKGKKKHLKLVIGSDKPGTGKSMLIEEIIDMFTVRKASILWIDSVTEARDEFLPYIINDRLFGETDIMVQPEHNLNKADKVYFTKEYRTVKTLLDKDQVEKLLADYNNYEIVIWEMFPAPDNLQLFATITSLADLLILVGRFNYSERRLLADIKEFVNNYCRVPIMAVLNYIEKSYIRWKY